MSAEVISETDVSEWVIARAHRLSTEEGMPEDDARQLASLEQGERLHAIGQPFSNEQKDQLTAMRAKFADILSPEN